MDLAKDDTCTYAVDWVASKLYGEAGKDTLWGNSGDDVLWGGPGTDKLSGGPGRNELHQD
ncbi:hypothetical protein [Streptomyces inhibens]|uniref:hypothetical protein n=1 Tax=Streptomyces inhibens TaxID=2293571 RepID=UPI0026CB8698